MTIGSSAEVSQEALADLRVAFRGPLITPEDPHYDEARKTWNGLIDRRPALIARCLGNSDIVAALGFAQAHRLPLSVRGGGHSVAGYGVCDDGVDDRRGCLVRRQ